MGSFKRWLVGEPLPADEVARLRVQLAQQAGQSGPTRRAAMTGGAAIVGSMAGRGGQQPAPMNAPPGRPILPGVQPGTSPGTVFARYVIIFGTNDGWFVYQSGTIPGPGNTPIAWGAAGTTDPFGNVLPFASTLGIASTATFSAGDTLITPDGIFTYSASPAAGLLIASVTQAAGTDQFADVTQKGINSYVTVSGVRYAVGLNQTGGPFTTAGLSVQDTANPPNAPAGVFAASSNGTVKRARTVLTSGLVTNTDAQAALTLQSKTDSSSTAGTATLAAGSVSLGSNGSLVVDDNAGVTYFQRPVGNPAGPLVGAALYANTNTVMAGESVSGFAGALPLSVGIQGGNTVNATGFNAAFTPVSIPANDANSGSGTTYRVTCGGHGTQAGTTATTLNFRLQAFGLSWGSSTDNGGVAAGASFHWRFTGELIVNSNGAASFFGTMVISQAAASAAGHATAMDTQVAAATVDPTTGTNITLQLGWTSTVNSPTIVCTGALVERLGA